MQGKVWVRVGIREKIDESGGSEGRMQAGVRETNAGGGLEIGEKNKRRMQARIDLD